MKHKSVQKLKKDLDKVFSEYIRKKHADWKGEVECYTCYKKFPIKNIQNGHFVSRVYTSLRWSIDNCKPQCYSCNIMKNGNMDEFAARLERETPGIVNQLNVWKHRPVSPLKALELELNIKEYKNKIKELE